VSSWVAIIEIEVDEGRPELAQESAEPVAHWDERDLTVWLRMFPGNPIVRITKLFGLRRLP
jgi:hypothetical protein